jgi:hypothetical protein
MNPLVIAGVVLFVIAILFILTLAASLLALAAFRLAPSLNGTILALTTSDIASILRRMPVYPAWWPGHEVRQCKPKTVMLALNPTEKGEYFSGFDPIHRPMFTPDKSEGVRFDFADRLPIENLIRRFRDDGVELFIVFVESSRTGARKIISGSKYTKGRQWYDLRPPDCPAHVRGEYKAPSTLRPVYRLGHQAEGISQRPR